MRLTNTSSQVTFQRNRFISSLTERYMKCVNYKYYRFVCLATDLFKLYFMTSPVRPTQARQFDIMNINIQTLQYPDLDVYCCRSSNCNDPITRARSMSHQLFIKVQTQDEYRGAFRTYAFYYITITLSLQDTGNIQLIKNRFNNTPIEPISKKKYLT